MQLDDDLGDAHWSNIGRAFTSEQSVRQARKEGTIGASLEAQVTLYTSSEYAQMLQKLGDELRFVLLTSSVTLKPLSEASSACLSTELAELKLKVAKTCASKCVRCWHHCDDIGTLRAC